MKKGQYFSATIEGKHVMGIIQEECGTFFLCQNTKNGNNASDKLGFEYSWNIRSGSDYDMERENVKNFKIISKREFLKNYPSFKPIITLPSSILGYDIKMENGKVRFGCGEVTVTPTTIKRFLEIFNNKRDREIMGYFINKKGRVPNEYDIKEIKALYNFISKPKK